jgi:hypothetical protein
MAKNPDPGQKSWINIPDHISESLATFFGLNIQINSYPFQYCGYGSGIRSLFDPWIGDGILGHKFYKVSSL